MGSYDRKLTFGILCNWVPYPIQSGSNQRLAELIRYLTSSGHQVDLVVIDSQPRRKLSFGGHQIRSVHYLNQTPPKSLGTLVRKAYWLVLNMFDHIGLSNTDSFFVKIRKSIRVVTKDKQENYWGLCPNKQVADSLPAIVEHGGWDVAIVEYLWLHPLVDSIPSKVLRIIDTHDVMHQRHDRLIKSGLHSPFPIDEAEEACLLGKFDCVIAIQDVERQTFLALRERYGLDFEVVTTGVSCSDSFENFVTIKSSSKVVLFVGGINVLNEDGLRRFATHLWPVIFAKHPDWNLNVCGAICSLFENCDWAGVKFLGLVDDLIPHYESAAFVINPVWAGTGLKIKSVEALSKGKPLLTTPSGIDGMAGNIADACIVARDEMEFLDKALYLIETPEAGASLSSVARTYFENNLSAKSVYGELDRYLRGARIGRLKPDKQ